MYPTDIADWTLDCCDPQAAPAPTVIARRASRSFACPVCQGDLTLPCADCDRLAAEYAADLADIEMDLARRLAG